MPLLCFIRRAVLSLVAGCAVSAVHAAPTTNILVTDFDGGTLSEFTRDGSLVRQVAIPSMDSGLRDVVQGSDGQVHMFNGTFNPSLTSFNPNTGQFQHRTVPGWSTVNNLSYGGIAIVGSQVFVTDMTTGSGGEATGFVRFDLNTGTTQRFAAPEFDDLTLGLDGLLYASAGYAAVYDPSTMTFLRDVTLQGATDVRGIAVDADGFIYAASWEGRVSKHDATGLLIDSLFVGNSLTDIDLNADGELVIGSRFGDVYLTDRSLAGSQSFNVHGSFEPNSHVAFGTLASTVPEPGTVALALMSLSLLVLQRRSWG